MSLQEILLAPVGGGENHMHITVAIIYVKKMLSENNESIYF